jgi:hypothetical protein
VSHGRGCDSYCVHVAYSLDLFSYALNLWSNQGSDYGPESTQGEVELKHDICCVLSRNCLWFMQCQRVSPGRLASVESSVGFQRLDIQNFFNPSKCCQSISQIFTANQTLS